MHKYADIFQEVMSLAYIIKFRTNRATYERLRQEAQSMGFWHISDYIRHRLFGPAMMVETLLKENNTILKELQKRNNNIQPHHTKIHKKSV